MLRTAKKKEASSRGLEEVEFILMIFNGDSIRQDSQDLEDLQDSIP